MSPLRELTACLIERLDCDGTFATAISGLQLNRVSVPGQIVHSVYRPTFCLIAQGSKRVLLGEDVTTYDTRHYLVMSHEMPLSGQVTVASSEAPYFSLSLDLNPQEVAELLLAVGTRIPAPAPSSVVAKGMYIGQSDTRLVEAMLRLVRLLQTPRDIAALAPLYLKEILYRLLMAEEGWRLAQIATANSQAQRVGRAIAWLREHYLESLQITTMAQFANMSESSLRQHFKAVTTMSPVQYQKELRLLEARRLLLAENLDAASVALQVGYESSSQFSREYARKFGEPPLRDIKRLRSRTLDVSSPSV